jgi:uncharacterized alkaline shock family protein YloU
MSTDITDRVTAEATASPPPPDGSPHLHGGDRDAGIRGRTTVAPAVMEQIAARAAAGVDGVRAGAVSTLRSWFGPSGTTQDDTTRGTGAGHVRAADLPDVEAEPDPDCGHTELRLTIGVEWPRPIAATAEAARRAAATEVERLTGVHVSRIDVEVNDLPGRRPPVRVQ